MRLTQFEIKEDTSLENQFTNLINFFYLKYTYLIDISFDRFKSFRSFKIFYESNGEVAVVNATYYPKPTFGQKITGIIEVAQFKPNKLIEKYVTDINNSRNPISDKGEKKS